MGAADNDFLEQAQRAASEIPTAEFLALGDANHYAAIPARTSCYSTPYCAPCARTADDAGAAQALMKLYRRDRPRSTHLELDVNADPWPIKEAPSR
jgi:hypothetical protein